MNEQVQPENQMNLEPNESQALLGWLTNNMEQSMAPQQPIEEGMEGEAPMQTEEQLIQEESGNPELVEIKNELAEIKEMISKDDDSEIESLKAEIKKVLDEPEDE